MGGDDTEQFPGRTASSCMLLEELSAFSMGALLAYHEHLVMFHGFLLNINPFDQPGVQLGKKLANELLSDSGRTPMSFIFKEYQ